MSRAEMRDSGVEWLGEIPSHWDVPAFKQVARLAYGDSLKADDRRSLDVPVYGSNGIVGFHDASNTKAPVIVVGRKGSFGKLNYSEIPAFAIDTTYFIDSDYSAKHLRWLFFLLHTLDLDGISKDSAVPGLSREDVYSWRLPLPPLNEQREIASFLDRETAKLDALTHKSQRLIELLREKRQALISHAVTKGLDEHAETRDSGVEWLGEIPSHWDVRSVGSAAQVFGGGTPSSQTSEYWDGDIPWLTPSDVTANDSMYVRNTSRRITSLGLESSAARVMPPGSVLMTSRASIGDAVINRVPMATNQGFINLVPDTARLNCKYLALWIGLQTDLLHVLGSGSTFLEITKSTFKALRLPLPPLHEQHAIAHFLDRETAKLDALIHKSERLIELLREKRKALISAAVTGKIDISSEA